MAISFTLPVLIFFTLAAFSFAAVRFGFARLGQTPFLAAMKMAVAMVVLDTLWGLWISTRDSGISSRDNPMDYLLGLIKAGLVFGILITFIQELAAFGKTGEPPASASETPTSAAANDQPH